jgi:hypothetical protein
MFKTPRLCAFIMALTIAFFLMTLAGCGGSVKQASTVPTATASPAPSPGSSGGSGASGSGSGGSAQNPGTVFSYGDIDDMSGWTSCGKVMNGRECAGGQASAPTSLTQHTTEPSMAGSSAHFWLGGSQQYSNVMWWRDLNTNNPQATKYRYEFYVYMTHPDLPEALEFDVNQGAKGIRWIFGTECSFRDTHHWDVWDADAHWVPTPVPCNVFQAGTWNHVVWNFERVDDHVHYVSVEVNGTSYKVDMMMKGDKSWPWGGSLNVAFQMDGNISQDNFDVWIDKVSLTGMN